MNPKMPIINPIIANTGVSDSDIKTEIIRIIKPTINKMLAIQ